MIWIIAAHVVRRSLYDRRIIVLSAVALAMFVVGGVVGAGDLVDRQRRYAEMQARAYAASDLEAAIFVRPPNPLAFVHRGSDEDLPRYVTITDGLVDYPADDVETLRLALASVELDWTFVLTYVISLICLLVTFDGISGEAERGTLRLIVMNGVARSTYFFGSFLGGLLTMVPLLLIGYLLDLLILTLLADLSLDASHAVALLLAFVASILLVAVFLSLGLLSSALSARASGSLLIALGGWLIFTFGIPIGSVLVAGLAAPAPTVTEMQADLQAAQRRFLMQSYPLSSLEIERISGDDRLSQGAKERRIARLQERIDDQNAQAMERYRAAIIEIRTRHFNALSNQVAAANAIGRASPVSAYEEVVGSLLGTGLPGQFEFLEHARNEMRRFTSYVARARRESAAEPRTREVVIETNGLRLRNIQGISYAGVEFDRSDYPRFSPPSRSSRDALKDAPLGLAVLATFPFLFLTIGYFQFVRYRHL